MKVVGTCSARMCVFRSWSGSNLFLCLLGVPDLEASCIYSLEALLAQFLFLYDLYEHLIGQIESYLLSFTSVLKWGWRDDDDMFQE